MSISPSTFNESRRPFLLLAVLCVVLLIPFLGETLFNTRGEPREAVVALSMLQDGNWVLPVNNGVDIAYKPPLFHWCIAIFSAMAGGVSEFTSRLPSALALTAMLLTGYAFYARRRGAETAFVAALVTLTNFEVHRAGVNCRVDMLLAAFMVMGLYALFRWTERGLRGLPWLAVLCLGGAALTKGPVGAVLPCMAGGVYVLLRGVNFWRALWKFLLVAVLGIVPLLAWYVAAWSEPTGGERFLGLIYEENVLRFMGKMSYESHVNPWHYNVMTMLTGLLPWTLLCLFSLFGLRRCRILQKKDRSGTGAWFLRLREGIRRMDDTRLFTLVSIVVMFVFYCIPKSKRSVYLLPIYPFVAYYMAELFLFLCRRRPGTVRVFGWTLSVLAVALTGTFIAVRAGWVTGNIFTGRHAAENASFLQALATAPLSWWMPAVLALPLLGALLFVRSQRQSGTRPLHACIAVVYTLFLTLDAFYQPTVLNVKSDKPVAERLTRLVPEGRIYSYRVENYDANRLHPFTINFYTGDRVVPFEFFRPQTGILVADRDAIGPFLATFPGYEAQLLYDSHRRSCDDKSRVCLFRFWKK